jgi:hypothetical protein
MEPRKPSMSVGKSTKISASSNLTQSGEDYCRLVRDDENSEHLMRQRFAEFGDALVVCKMPQFDMTDEQTETDLAGRPLS